MTFATASPLADTWGMHGDIGTGWWIVMVAGMIVFWGAIILVAVRVLRDTVDPHRNRSAETPLMVLQRRLSEGTISVEEYERRRGVLAGSDGAAADVPGHDTGQSATSGQPAPSR